MTERYSTDAKRVWPYLLPRIEKILRNAGVGGSGGGGGTIEITGGAPSPHALDSPHHTGLLADAQAPQFLKSDGSRQLTGNLTVAPGMTIDGVDLGGFKALYDAHIINPSAHHAPVTAGAAIGLSGQQVSVALAASSGLSTSGGLNIANSVAGNGLGITAGKVMSVNVKEGIEIDADFLRVDEDYAFIWEAQHRFNADLQVYADIDFVGAHRTITTNGWNLNLSPGGNLYLSPTLNVLLPNAQELRTETVTDLPTGINGMRMWDVGSNYRGIIAGVAKFDELRARVFVADETRVDRGQEYWSKSFGIVLNDWVMPDVNGFRQVVFESSPAFAGNLFTVGDAILFRIIDWGTGLTISRFWMRVHAFTSSGTTSDGVAWQEWHLQHITGGTPGQVIKSGSVGVCAGQVGQGWIHLSALSPDGGPFIQMGSMTSNYSVGSQTAPGFTNYVRMGNLNGVAGISSDTWGFAAGNNLGLAIGAGFKGILVDPTQGVRIYDAGIWVKDGAGRGVLGVHGGASGSVSWGGLTLTPGDILIGDSVAGGYLQWDESASGAEKLKLVNSAISISQEGGGSLFIDSYGVDIVSRSNFYYPYGDLVGYAGSGFPGIKYYYEGSAMDFRFGENSSTNRVDFMSWLAAEPGHGKSARNILAASLYGDTDLNMPGTATVLLEAAHSGIEGSGGPGFETAYDRRTSLSLNQSKGGSSIVLNALGSNAWGGLIDLNANIINLDADISVNLNGPTYAADIKRLRSGTTGGISPNSATSFPVPAFPSMLIAWPGSGSTRFFMIHFRSNSALPVVLSSAGAGSVAVATGPLDGTSATGGNVNVSVHTDNACYIENKYGYGINYTYLWLT